MNSTSSKKSPKIWTIDEFLGIEDNDLQKLLYANHYVRYNFVNRYVDNEDKIGFYYVEQNIAQNKSGKFYRNSRLIQWIVYDKKTKKVRMSKEYNTVWTSFLKRYLHFPELIMRFVRKPTATLCKKIVEGKLKSLRDLMAYHRSYTLRDKTLDIDKIYEAIVYGFQDYMCIFEDPNSIDYRSLGMTHDRTVLGLIRSCMPFKIKNGEDIKEKYEEWIIEQTKKYVKITGCPITTSGSDLF